ncbi:MAG: beta-lactamase family protein [Anaerolineae bacterium]|nr:beta-lactamase family protein [Anaerolineae bacterium]
MSYKVLGVLIARVTSQPLDVFFRERIFAPLGMKDTGFSVPHEQLHRLPACYEADGETGALKLFDDASNSRWNQPPAFPQASGGLVSTVDDYLRFGQMLLNKGKLEDTRILSRPSVELMMTNHLTPEQRAAGRVLLDGRGWGFGGAVNIDRDQIYATPGRYGWDGGYGTSFAVDPQVGLVAILMTQVGFPRAIDLLRNNVVSVVVGAKHSGTQLG